VIAAVHSGFKFDRNKQTARILKAMDNPYVRIIGHPTGRLIQKRQAYSLDLEKIYNKAKEKRIALEINASPDRLDLNAENIKNAINKGVKLIIGTDSHSKTHLACLELGTATCRRGWASKKDILNTMDLKGLRKFLRKT
jgi:DNA polymerase (family 10)